MEWVTDPAGTPPPPRAVLAAAVRSSARALADKAPGKTVEVRIPPFIAVQCIAGPAHTRGTPPNVFETDPLTWLQLATGQLLLDAALSRGLVDASGSRVGEVAGLLPVISL
ncbi:sterol carrier family protein [Corynebacterium nasicanis]